MVRVVYEDESVDVFVYGEEQNVISDGICISQKIKCKVNTGDKVKKGDIICYNEEFFEDDPYSTQVSWKHGVNATIALIENDSTLEDSNLVTRDLSRKLSMQPTEMSKPINMTKDTIVHYIAKVGDQVKHADRLMQFEDAGYEGLGGITSDYLSGVLSKLDQHIPKVKHSGEIVKIEVFYSCSTSEMHPSLAKVVKEIDKFKLTRHRFAQGTDNSLEHLPPSPLPEGTKYKNIIMDKDTVVFLFYTKQTVTFESGDKCVFGNQMKSVSAKNFEGDILTESGIKVDGVFSATSLSKRIVLSTQLVGVGNRVLEQAERNILDMWDA